jgi:hypothetical protein
MKAKTTIKIPPVKIPPIPETTMELVKGTAAKHGYHISFDVKSNYHNQVQFQDSPTGCGLMLMSKWTGMTADCVWPAFKDFFTTKVHPHLKQLGVGGVMLTAGQPFYEKAKKLKEIGAVEITEYANYTHDRSGDYGQKLFIIKI